MGGIVLDLSRSDAKYASLKDTGISMLTIAIVSVLLTAPLGAILINTLGEKWLDKHLIKLSKAEMKNKSR